jgi:hypothetical protein
MVEKDGQLIQSFRKQRDEYHIPLRKESWEKLETELLSRSAFRRQMYRWMSAAAVILVCLALSLPFLLKKDMSGMVAETLPGNSMETTTPHKGNEFQMQEQQTISVIASTSVSISAGRKIPDGRAAAEAKEEASPVVIPDELPAEEEIIFEEEKTEKPETTSFTGPQQEKRTVINYTPPAVKNKQQNKWAFGLSAGSNNAKGSTYEQTDKEPGIVDPPYTGPDEGPGTGSGIGEEEEEEEPGAKAYAFPLSRSQRETTRYHYHHKLPISIGISVQKKLSNHFGLESGLTYTYLYSDISKEGVAGYIGNQQLHYLGIPVKANWLVYNRKRFSVYLSGGTLVEYCISAGRKIENQNERLDFNRFQVSLNVAAGMQFVLAKPLSVFVEPGVSYFMDNGGGVETIRTDNPFMFNLQAGVRFTY